MTQRIIFPDDEGGVSVFIPADTGLPLDEVAKVVVPAGKPYKIVDAADIPSDRSERNAWEVDEALLTDGVGADYGVGSTNKVVGWNEDGTPVVEAQA